jgi:hypothetical protein
MHIHTHRHKRRHIDTQTHAHAQIHTDEHAQQTLTARHSGYFNYDKPRLWGRENIGVLLHRSPIFPSCGRTSLKRNERSPFGPCA